MCFRLMRLKFVWCIYLFVFLYVIEGTAQDVASLALSDDVCSDEVQQVACFYDRSRSAIIGVEYTLRNSRAKRRLCHTAGQPGNTVRLRRGVGVTKLTVRSVASRVLSLEFKLSNGRTASCRVASLVNAKAASASSAATPAAAVLDSMDFATTVTASGGSGLAAGSVVEEYLNSYPGRIGGSPSVCTGRNCGGGSPSPSPPPSPPQRSRVYVGPSAAYVLAGLSGSCASSGAFTDSLQAVTRPCWVRVASSPSPSPVASPSPPPPSPQPSPRPSPTPKPPSSPSPRPSPSPSPSPKVSPSPSPVPRGPDGAVNVTLYARGQATCSTFGPDAVKTMGVYMTQQLVLLGLGTYSVKQDSSDCTCSSQQGVPMYSCNFSVQGPSSSPWEGPAVARYLAASLTAAGQQFCSSQSAAQSLSSLCGSNLQVTGLCAASLQSNSAPLSCTVPTPPKDWQMSVSFGIPAATCSSSSINMTADGVGSLVQYLSGFLPGYNVTLPAWATSPLTCSRVQGNAYYQVPAVTIAASRKIDTRGAAEYLAATLNNQQPGPCSSDRSGGSTSASSIRPAFCSELPQMPVMCGTATYTYKDAPVGCSSAGASFNILFMNPNDKCEKGNPPPEEIGLSLDFWWRQQLDWLSNGKLHNATTVLPGEATSVNGVCNYWYTVTVFGPISFTPQQIDDTALELMSSALMHRPIPCASWRGTEFCKYFDAATFCAAMAPSRAEC